MFQRLGSEKVGKVKIVQVMMLRKYKSWIYMNVVGWMIPALLRTSQNTTLRM